MDQDAADFCTSEHPRLVGLLGLHTGDRALAEELAQEALARAWHDWKKVKQLENPAAWLYHIALNLATSNFRRISAERRARDRIGPAMADHQDPDGADRQAVRNAVRALPPRQRTALILRYYLDLAFADIAELMDAPEATVKSHVRRALSRLRNESGLIEPREIADVT